MERRKRIVIRCAIGGEVLHVDRRAALPACLAERRAGERLQHQHFQAGVSRDRHQRAQQGWAAAARPERKGLALLGAGGSDLGPRRDGGRSGDNRVRVPHQAGRGAHRGAVVTQEQA